MGRVKTPLAPKFHRRLGSMRMWQQRREKRHILSHLTHITDLDTEDQAEWESGEAAENGDESEEESATAGRVGVTWIGIENASKFSESLKPERPNVRNFISLFTPVGSSNVSLSVS